MVLRVAGKDIAKAALRNVFELGQRVGVDVLPRHFYSAIPDVRALRSSVEWRQPRSLHSIRGADLAGQAEALRYCFDGEVSAALATHEVWADACAANGAIGYGPIEAEVLYAYIAHHQPRCVIQVGAGVSTAVILAAARHAGYRPEIVCVDPFPTAYLRERAVAGEVELVATPAQQVSAEQLAAVGPDGLLFVDSTHTVKPGSEVNGLILEVLPRLPSGARAHFHDITLPFDYAPDLLSRALFFWEETALLLAYLSNNDRVSIEVSLSMLHHSRPDVISTLLPRYQPAPFHDGIRVGSGHFPCATYLNVL